MNSQDPNPSRNQRLQFLRDEQARVRRSRVLRRNGALSAAMVLLVGGVVWMVSPRQQPLQPAPSPRQASTQTQIDLRPRERVETAAEGMSFRIMRVSDRPLKLTMVVETAEPERVEYLSDLQLFIAMRSQGIDAGLVRIGGQTQLAFNDEESRQRFERGSDSAE